VTLEFIFVIEAGKIIALQIQLIGGLWPLADIRERGQKMAAIGVKQTLSVVSSYGV